MNHRCEFTRVSSCASQPGVFQFRAEMFVRRADKIIQENSREERERERESSLSISKYRKSWRVASKKRRSKTFFTAETNVCLDRPLILLLRISCAHTKGTQTYTYYYRSVYRGSFSRKLMHGLRKFYSNLIVGRNGARAFEIREIRAGVFPRRKRLRYTRIISL